MRFGTKRIRSFVITAITALLGSSTIGCGHTAILSTSALPVHRVVVYRNGVAYFERAGHVSESEVRFKMKQTEIGDFLATLSVMEQGGSSVRAAAFPLEQAEERLGPDEKPKPLTADQKSGLQTVVLSLDGNEHDLQVGYVTESPVWKPSYRLLVGKTGKAGLQVWGIVENLSGEEWKDVKLSLRGGAPLAFRADLGTPVIPERPTVTDQGEVISSVPRGETSLAQDDKAGEPQMAPPPPPAPAAAAALNESAASGGAPQGHAKGAMMKRESAFAPAPSAAPRNVHALAAIAVEGGATRYDLPNAVSVPDRSATMVMLVSRDIPGETIFLFAPDQGVPDSYSHPFRVARFTNGTEGALDRGPIAVFEEGAFLGQGMIEPLPAGATATVPFALERSLAIDHERKQDEAGLRVARIENSELTIEKDRVTQTKYRVRNGGDTAAKLMVKHPRISGARLLEPPSGTDDNVGTGAALIPATVAPRATVELVADERATEKQGADWFGQVAETSVRALLADAKLDHAVGQKLAAAWAIRTDIVKKRGEHDTTQRQVYELSRSTEETRKNLVAIEKNKTADDLRLRLTKRLAEASAELDARNRKLVELDLSLSELTIRWKEAIHDVHWTAPTR